MTTPAGKPAAKKAPPAKSASSGKPVPAKPAPDLGPGAANMLAALAKGHAAHGSRLDAHDGRLDGHDAMLTAHDDRLAALEHHQTAGGESATTGDGS